MVVEFGPQLSICSCEVVHCVLCSAKDDGI